MRFILKSYCAAYPDCGEILSAPIAQQTEEEQQRVDAHPVPAWQYSLQITHGPQFSLWHLSQ